MPDAIQEFRARNGRMQILVFDPLEEGEPGEGYLRVTDLEAIREAVGHRTWMWQDVAWICPPELQEEWAPQVQQMLEEGEVLGRVRHQTLVKNTDDWTDIALQTLPHMAGRVPIQAFAGQGKGKPALIVGAGPSLEYAMEWLPALQDRLIIIAAETALPVLDRGGVQPDIVVAVESMDTAYFGLEGLKSWDKAILVLGAHTHQMAWDIPARAICPALQAIGPVGTWLVERLKVPSVESGGSVATACYGVAHMLDCETVFGVGIDSAYSYGRYYADGVMRPGGLDATRYSAPTSTDMLPAFGGEGEVGSNEQMKVYRDWLSSRARTYSNRWHVNLSKGGARINGWDEMLRADVRELLEGYPVLEPLAIPDKPLDLSWAAASLREQLSGAAHAKDCAEDAIRAFNRVAEAVGELGKLSTAPTVTLINHMQFSPLDELSLIPSLDSIQAGLNVNLKTCECVDKLIPWLQTAIERLEEQHVRAA